MSNKTVFIISGPLGAGKTSVSKMITETFNNCVLIEGDIMFLSLEKIDKLSWEERLELTWKNLISVSKNYLEQDLSVVIDFVLEEELNWIYKEFSDLDVVIKYVVLTTDKATISKRLKERGDLKFLDRSLVIFDKLHKDPLNKNHLLDTSKKTLEEIAKDIIHKDVYKLHLP